MARDAAQKRENMINHWEDEDFQDLAILVCYKTQQWMPHMQLADELKNEFAAASDEADFFKRGRRVVEKFHNLWSGIRKAQKNHEAMKG